MQHPFSNSDWSDWQAHPVSAVCLFCDHQSETMDQIYTHMKVGTVVTPIVIYYAFWYDVLLIVIVYFFRSAMVLIFTN